MTEEKKEATPGPTPTPRPTPTRCSALKKPRVWACLTTGNLVKILGSDGVTQEERTANKVTTGEIEFKDATLTFCGKKNNRLDIGTENDAKTMDAIPFQNEYGPINDAELKIILRLKEKDQDAAVNEVIRRAKLPYPRTLEDEKDKARKEKLKEKAIQAKRRASLQIRRHPALGLSPVHPPYTLTKVREAIDRAVDHLVELKLVERELLAVVTPPSGDMGPVTPRTTPQVAVSTPSPSTLTAPAYPSSGPPLSPNTAVGTPPPCPQPQHPPHPQSPYTPPIPGNGVQTKQAADALKPTEKTGRKG